MFLAAAVLARRSNLAGFAPDAGNDADAACSQQHTAVRAQAAWPEVPLCRGQGMDLKVWRDGTFPAAAALHSMALSLIYETGLCMLKMAAHTKRESCKC